MASSFFFNSDSRFVFSGYRDRWISILKAIAEKKTRQQAAAAPRLVGVALA